MGAGMQGVKLVIWMLPLVLPWLRLTSASANNGDSTQVTMTTVGMSAQTYRDFIARVRAALHKEGSTIHSIPVLPSKDGLPPPKQFILLNLSNKAGHSVSLALDAAEIYFRGYDAGNSTCVLKNGMMLSVSCHPIPRASKQQMASMNSLSSSTVAGLGRPGTMADLDQAISSLYLFTIEQATATDVARGISVLDTMISSALLFPQIEWRVSQEIQSGNQATAPVPSAQQVARPWLLLSAAIQESHQGIFSAPVVLYWMSNGQGQQPLELDNVRLSVPLVALLHYHCKKINEARQEESSFQLRRQAMSILAPDFYYSGGDDNAPPTTACKETEQTSRIIGADGMCVTVWLGMYHNGNLVQLAPCTPGAGVSQLWTFKKDGTIRSSGKCLASYGDTPGDYIMVYDCVPSPSKEFFWEVRVDGTIASKNGLVLTANSTGAGTMLTAQADDRSSTQSWTPTNNTWRFVSTIVGFQGLCLQARGEAVWMAECAAGSPEQLWAIYPDSTIRPQQDHIGCLAPYINDRVMVVPCAKIWLDLRWAILNDGTILNWRSGKVMDVRQSDPSLKEVIVYTPTGNPNQQWALMP